MGVFDIKGEGIIYHHIPTLLKNRPRPFKKQIDINVSYPYVSKP